MTTARMPTVDQEGTDMAEQNAPDEDHTAVDPEHEDGTPPTAPEVSSPELDHLQHTIDDARNAAKAALSDQPEV